MTGLPTRHCRHRWVSVCTRQETQVPKRDNDWQPRGSLLVACARTAESLEWDHRDSVRQRQGRRVLRSHFGREDDLSRLARCGLTNGRSSANKAAKKRAGPYPEGEIRYNPPPSSNNTRECSARAAQQLTQLPSPEFVHMLHTPGS